MVLHLSLLLYCRKFGEHVQLFVTQEMSTTTKGLFINRNKAIIDLSKHGDIMEDAIDRIKVKEAMKNGQFIDWEDAKQSIDKKHGIDGLPNTNRKKGSKVPLKRS
jgi:hypothetical protein